MYVDSLNVGGLLFTSMMFTVTVVVAVSLTGVPESTAYTITSYFSPPVSKSKRASGETVMMPELQLAAVINFAGIDLHFIVS